MSYWFDTYIQRPWAAVPEPPKSFTCGELCRWILRERLGIETLPIYADAASLRQCIGNLAHPEMYDLTQVIGRPRPYDLVFLARNTRFDHMGIAVTSRYGLRVLHCCQGAGVLLQSAGDLVNDGFRRQVWFRHQGASEELVLCRA